VPDGKDGAPSTDQPSTDQPTDRPTWWRTDGGAVVLRVRVTPGGRRNEVLDGRGERLRLRVAARAVEGRANAELERFVAEMFGVRPRAVEIVGGRHARDKIIRVDGVSAPPPELTGPPGRPAR
jgi:uncharacterized protein